MPSFLIVIIAGLFGAALASFLEVVADRLPKGEKPFGRSRCDSCKRTLRWFELVPIVSWLLLRGKCRTCGSKIPVRHVLVEAGLATAFALAAIVTLVTTETGAWWLLAFRLAVLSALALVILADFRFYIIPDAASLGLAAFFAPFVVSSAFFAVPWDGAVLDLKSAGLGALFGTAFLGVFAIVSRGTWMGWGDVKLAFGLSFAFGFPAILFLLALSFVLGAIAGLSLIALHRKTMRDILPFGPFIAMAALPFVFGYGRAIEQFLDLADFFLL